MRERSKTHNSLRIPEWKISLDTDEITVGLVFLKTAECASLVGWGQYPDEQPDLDETPEPKAFANAAEARDYLVNQGILDAGILTHFPDIDAISTNGQLFCVVGALYTALMDQL
jgi:hypothetical protein